MLKFATKSIIKYLIILVLTFMVGMSLLFVTHILLDKKVDKYTKKHELVSSYQKKLNDISHLIIGIKAHIFEITAATQATSQRNYYNSIIEKDIKTIISLVTKLNENFKNTEKFLSELKNINQTNQILLEIIERREIELKSGGTSVLLIAKEIRRKNSLIPQQINSLLNHVKESKSILDKTEIRCVKVIKAEKEKYFYVEIVIGVIILFITLFLSRLISNHIVKLYRRLEKQLYIDELTQLENRFALQKTYQIVKNPLIIILNIDLFRVINELYGTDTGNEVLKKLAVMMTNYFKDTNFELFRIAGDEFVLFDEDTKFSSNDIEKLILGFLAFIKENKIYIKSIEESIDIDFTCGVSTCKDNFLGKADMALNHAKKNGLRFTIYRSDIDNKVELKYNLFWNKEIQNGIKNSMFLPFFQPIFDRHGVISKYESLMRLKREDDIDTSFVPPIKFLEIARKTKNYDQISLMTILKSLDFCKKTGFNTSINIDRLDMQNIELIAVLKEKLVELNIADKIVFEVLENESLVDNIQVKYFIDEFRDLGVRFAIDDFGAGYSNFSFILELKPDFLKIDGSLIKNIATDKNSFELVKSIVAFAKALDIVTVAEFVHSKDVYEIVFELGIDQFQGYYLGEPKEFCL